MNLDGKLNEAVSQIGANPRVIFVDLDDTLLKIDLFRSSLAVWLLRNPIKAAKATFQALFKLGSSRQALKHELASQQAKDFDFVNVPKREDLADWLLKMKRSGSEIVLCSAASVHYKQGLTESFPWIDDFLMSSSEENLKGAAKSSAMEAWCSNRGIPFESAFFIGNQGDDDKVADSFSSVLIPKKEGSSLRASLSAMRPEQWIKNVLVFLPAIFVSFESLTNSIPSAIGAFVILSMLASGTYLVNDILDLHSDMKHKIKASRAIAAGRLDALSAIGLSIGLILSPMLVSWIILGTLPTLVLAAYLFGNLAYSTYLKRVAIVDLFSLAGLYLLRVVLGSVIFSSSPSVWFISFLFFGFLGLAAAKRTSEFNHLGEGDLSSRKYTLKDSELVSEIAVGSFFGALITLSLYVELSDQADIFSSSAALWMVVPSIGLIFLRLLRASRHGWMKSDPVRWVLRDPISVFTCALILIGLVALRILAS